MPRRPENWNERLNKAIQNQPRLVRAEEAKARLKKIKDAIDARKRQKQFIFDMWSFADKFCEALELIRDMNAPKDCNCEFNDDFISAVSMIPYVRERARDLWLDYIFYNDYADVLKLINIAENNDHLMNKIDGILKNETTDTKKLEKLNGLLVVTFGKDKNEIDINTFAHG